MNPLTNVRNIQKLNERELECGITGTASWHHEYKDSAWLFIGGLPYELSEGDIITVFSQYGEVVNINLIRDKKTGKSKGYAFLCYEDQRSTILAVDNLNGIQILKRTIRVDHVMNYKMPKDHEDDDEISRKLKHEGCAPKFQNCESDSSEVEELPKNVKIKKAKKKKSKKLKKEKKRHHDSNLSFHSSPNFDIKVKVKIEKIDPSYGDYTDVQRHDINKDVNKSRSIRKRNIDNKKFPDKSHHENGSKSISHGENNNTRILWQPSVKDNDKHVINNRRRSTSFERNIKPSKRGKINDQEDGSYHSRHWDKRNNVKSEKYFEDKHERDARHSSISKHSYNEDDRYKRTHSSERDRNVDRKTECRRRSRSKEMSLSSNKNRHHSHRKISNVYWNRSRSRSRERF